MSTTNDRGRGPTNPNPARAPLVPPRAPVSIDLSGSDSEYDAVTELFLGEGSAVPASKPVSKIKSIAEPLTAWKVVGRPEDMDDPDDPNEPDLLAQTSAFDSIAPQGTLVDSPQIEAIVQGHLPVFAAAWITQYARSRAEELHLAVVLIRVRQGFCSVECVLPSGTPAMSMAPSETMDAAIDLARGMGARHWIIQTDEVNEPDLWRLNRVNRITILTSADEAALVACYRALKGIAQATGAESETEIHVAVMGATPEKAAHAIERVTRAGENFLGRSVSGSMAAAKIGAGTASSLYRSNSDSTTLHEVIDAIASPPATQPAAPAAGSARADAIQREMAAMREAIREASISAPMNSSRPALEPLHLTDQPDMQPLADEIAADAEETVPPAETPVTRPASLIELIDDIEPLGVSCPSAGGVDFGIAPDGRLHLVAHVEGELNSGHPSNQSRAVEDLFVASAWATAHSRLLLTAHASIRLDEKDHAPILHVVTAKPREARRLLDTSIRVHLVLPPPEDNGWISMELN